MHEARRLPLAVLAAIVISAVSPSWAQAPAIPETMPEGASLSGEEDHPTLVLPEPKAHWVHVQDVNFPYLTASKTFLIDGDTMGILGMANTGYVPNPVLALDNSAFYSTETFWSRGSRGERTDVVTIFDPRRVEAVGEIPLPEGRFLVVPKKPNAALTTDGRYLLSYNMDPSTGVSLVDVKDRKYIGELETPGCALIFPTGPTSFSMLCADGSFANVGFDATGGSKVTSSPPFFNSEQDPVFEHAAVHRPSQRAFFVSYEGWVYPVELREPAPVVGERFRLEGAEGWRPGGWQLATFHAATNRLFVLMHQGGNWTHKKPGEEVWVYDTAGKKLLQRIPLEHHAISVTVTQDDQPLLFVLDEAARLSSYDATSYEHKGDKEGVGISPFLLSVYGE
jgi:methylamine dehydrogenase heavy chain